jgi:hypothetical protein
VEANSTEGQGSSRAVVPSDDDDDDDDHRKHQCLCRTFILLPQETLMSVHNICCYHRRLVSVHNIYIATTGDWHLCRTFMLIAQETLVSVQNIYVAATGDWHVCRTFMLLAQETLVSVQNIYLVTMAVKGFHLQTHYLTAMEDTYVCFVFVASIFISLP